jgi:hypothetical protein
MNVCAVQQGISVRLCLLKQFTLSFYGFILYIKWLCYHFGLLDSFPFSLCWYLQLNWTSLSHYRRNVRCSFQSNNQNCLELSTKDSFCNKETGCREFRHNSMKGSSFWRVMLSSLMETQVLCFWTLLIVLFFIFITHNVSETGFFFPMSGYIDWTQLRRFHLRRRHNQSPKYCVFSVKQENGQCPETQ